MPKQTSQGTCYLCGKKFGKATMTRHLAKCKQAQLAKPGKASRAKPKRILHLAVAGRYAPYYWMHVEIPADATLARLDDFLRRIWLECCGHLSAFEIAGQRYSVAPADEDFFWEDDFHEEDFNHALREILEPGIKFDYEYDFGSTTHLTLQVISEREGIAKGEAVQILARNDPPEILCEQCKKQPAAWVCSVCIYNDKAWYCDKCAPKHKCNKRGEDYFLPVVNSPRVGTCGYTGEPY